MANNMTEDDTCEVYARSNPGALFRAFLDITGDLRFYRRYAEAECRVAKPGRLVVMLLALMMLAAAVMLPAFVTPFVMAILTGPPKQAASSRQHDGEQAQHQPQFQAQVFRCNFHITFLRSCGNLSIRHIGVASRAGGGKEKRKAEN